MGIRGAIGAGLGAVLLVGIGLLPAQADQVCNDLNSCSYSLDTFIGTGTPPPGPYGTITISQSGANIDVSVALAANTYFSGANSGAGEALLWDFNGDPAISVHLTGTSIGQFTFDAGPNIQADGSGHWDYGFECTACGQGGSPPHINSLTFTIDNMTLAAFITNDLGNLFASDLCLGLANGRCTVTGDVLAHLTSQVPEPVSLSLFGVGLLAMGAVGRRRKKSARA